jgi:hypothetical protein
MRSVMGPPWDPGDVLATVLGWLARAFTPLISRAAVAALWAVVSHARLQARARWLDAGVR